MEIYHECSFVSKACDIFCQQCLQYLDILYIIFIWKTCRILLTYNFFFIFLYNCYLEKINFLTEEIFVKILLFFHC